MTGFVRDVVQIERGIRIIQVDRWWDDAVAHATTCHAPDSNIAIDDLGIVQRYDNQRASELPFVEIGYMILERDEVFAEFPQPDCSFSAVLSNMVANKKIGAWVQHDAYHSISDPERWKKAERYLKPKKILLIDRDGVINHKAPKGEYINRWEDFHWIERTRNSMRRLAQLGFRFIVVSNQAGIARGITCVEEVERIHQQMTQSLAAEGVEILQVYFCPHHWEEGCECRKPKPGCR